MDINSIDKFYIMLHNIAACHAVKQNRIKRQKKYAQNKESANLYIRSIVKKRKI